MKFTFTEQEANVILQSLSKQPFEVVYQIIANMQKQATEQLNKEPKTSDDNETS